MKDGSKLKKVLTCQLSIKNYFNYTAKKEK